MWWQLTEPLDCCIHAVKLLPVSTAEWRTKQVTVHIDMASPRLNLIHPPKYSQVGVGDPPLTKPGEPRNSALQDEDVPHFRFCRNYPIQSAFYDY